MRAVMSNVRGRIVKHMVGITVCALGLGLYVLMLGISPTSILRVNDDRKGYEFLHSSIMSNYSTRLKSLKRLSHGNASLFLDVGRPPTETSSRTPSVRSEPKLILLWTPFFGKTNWLQNSHFAKCPARNCKITTDKSSLNQSDAVLFHGRDTDDRQLPRTRRPSQRWAYYILESPRHVRANIKRLNGVFNWTISYRQDSDIPIAYGGFWKRTMPLDEHLLESWIDAVILNKTKLVAARITNCNSISSQRIQYIRELLKHIPVDFYGACGNLSCPHGEKGDALMKQYKFFLSFENSNCRDYITEKFWLPLGNWNAVPVVMGGEHPLDYSAVAPNSSFLHVSGFPSARHLADLLELLDQHDDLYRSYFTWRRYWEVHSLDWCPLCAMLNDEHLPAQTYRDFEGWYNQDVCTLP